MNSYSIIPTLILTDREIKPNAKLLYCCLNSLANKYGHTAVDNGTLQTMLGTGERNIQLLLKQLEEHKYIKIDVKNGRRTITPLMTFKEPKKKKQNSLQSLEESGIFFEEL